MAGFDLKGIFEGWCLEISMCCDHHLKTIINSMLNEQLTKQRVVHIQDKKPLSFSGRIEFLHLIIFYSASNFSQIFLSWKTQVSQHK